MNLDDYFKEECIDPELAAFKIKQNESDFADLKKLEFNMLNAGGRSTIYYFNLIYALEEFYKPIESENQHKTRAQVEYVLERTSPSDTILDVGCAAGLGTVALALGRKPNSVRGIDISINAIIRSKMRAAKYSTQVCFLPLNAFQCSVAPSNSLVAMNLFHDGFSAGFGGYSRYLSEKTSKLAALSSKRVFIGLSSSNPLSQYEVIARALRSTGFNYMEIRVFNSESKKFEVPKSGKLQYNIGSCTEIMVFGQR